MIRKGFILFTVLLAVGFAPALAQEVFIKKNKGTSAEAGGKPTLYIKPKVTAATAKQSVIKYKDKLKVKQLKLASAAKAKDLAYWKETGAEPITAQEITMYADAHRAVAQNLMYQRREALMVKLRKDERKRLASISNLSQGALELQSGAVSGKNTKSSKTKKPKSKKKRIFVKSEEDKAKPTKVFTGYR